MSSSPTNQVTSSSTRNSLDSIVKPLDLEQSQPEAQQQQSKRIKLPFMVREMSRKTFYILLAFTNLLILVIILGVALGVTLKPSNISSPAGNSTYTHSDGPVEGQNSGQHVSWIVDIGKIQKKLLQKIQHPNDFLLVNLALELFFLLTSWLQMFSSAGELSVFLSSINILKC